MGGMLLLSASPSRGEVGSRALGEVTGVRPEEEYLRLCEDDEAVKLSSCTQMETRRGIVSDVAIRCDM